MAFRFRWSGLWWTHYHSWTSWIHLSRFHHNPLKFSLYFFPYVKICLLILQTLFSHVTVLVKVPNGSSLGDGRLVLSSPFNEFVNKYIDVWNEDVLYNWTNRPLCLYPRLACLSGPQRKCISLLFKLWLICVPRLDHLLQIYLHSYICALPQEMHSQFLHQILCLTIFHLASNIIKAYQSLGHHILALESNLEVFMEVLEPFIEVAMLKLDVEHVHNFDINFLVEKWSRRLFDYE